MEERLVRNQEATGSNPAFSTRSLKTCNRFACFYFCSDMEYTDIVKNMKTLQETERLLLIPIDDEIIDALLESDESFNHTFGLINDGGEYLNPFPGYLLKIRERLLACPQEYPLAVDQLIVLKESGTVIGTIYFKSLPVNGTSEIGYGINKPYRSKGYASEALQAMLSYGRENGISRVIADTMPDNLASQKVLSRNGFTLKEKRNGKLLFTLNNDPH